MTIDPLSTSSTGAGRAPSQGRHSPGAVGCPRPRRVLVRQARDRPQPGGRLTGTPVPTETVTVTEIDTRTVTATTTVVTTATVVATPTVTVTALPRPSRRRAPSSTGPLRWLTTRTSSSTCGCSTGCRCPATPPRSSSTSWPSTSSQARRERCLPPGLDAPSYHGRAPGSLGVSPLPGRVRRGDGGLAGGTRAGTPSSVRRPASCSRSSTVR